MDGGGGGRRGDDRKIDMKEWMNGYHGVTGHGFVGLRKVAVAPTETAPRGAGEAVEEAVGEAVGEAIGEAVGEAGRFEKKSGCCCCSSSSPRAAQVVDQKTAKVVFGQIDDNGGGVIMLDEWCDYIKNWEITAGTAMGRLLAADEGVDGLDDEGNYETSKEQLASKVRPAAPHKATLPRAFGQKGVGGGGRAVANNAPTPSFPPPPAT